MPVALLYLQQELLARCLYVAQFVQFGTHAGSYHAALVDEHWRVGAQRGLDVVAQWGQGVELAAHLCYGLAAVGVVAGILERGGAFECAAQLLQFTRIGARHCHLAHYALHVAYFGQFHLAQLAKVGVLEEVLHTVLPRHDGLHRA